MNRGKREEGRGKRSAGGGKREVGSGIPHRASPGAFLWAALIVGALRIARLQVAPFSRAWWPFSSRRVVGLGRGPSGRSAQRRRARTP